MTIKLFVEGGGDSRVLKTACREGFAEFLLKAGLGGNMPRIVACGSRRAAFEDFCTAISNSQRALLLVDSETPVDSKHQKGDDNTLWKPWSHLVQREGSAWTKPKGAEDMDCHLMVQCMESWLVADRQTLQEFFNPGFKLSALPAQSRAIENLDKEQLYATLEAATADCKTKARYDKGEHSFKLLAKIDAARVIAASPWADRFVGELKARMGT